MTAKPRQEFWRWTESNWKNPDLDWKAARYVTVGIDVGSVSSQDPRAAQAYNNRGIAWAQKGDLDQAISDFTMALEINPSYAQAYSNRGVTWAEKGELESGLTDAKKALSLEPKNKSYQSIVTYMEEQIGKQ